MRARRIIATAAAAGLVFSAGCMVATATSSDPCEGSYVAPMNSTDKLKRYNDCRFDRIDAAQKRIEGRLGATTPAPSQSPTPTPSATPSATPTRTPSPTPMPTPTATTAAPAAFPDATNTGVPAGTTLTAYAGPMTITTAGTVIDSKRITGCIVIKANNVTISRSLLQSNGCFFNVLSDNGNTGLKLTDVEIDGQNNVTGDSAINGGGFTCLRCDIHGTLDGIKAQSNVVVQDSYIHDLAMTADSHNDGIQSLGTTSLQIRHNTIVVKDGATSAVILSTGSASDMRNVAIDSNLLGGGAFTVYGGYQAGTDTLSKVSNIAVTNNRFTTQIFPRSGAYGPLTSTSSPVVVSGNVWHDGPNVSKPVT
jgi:hypothetical protein